MDTLSLGFFAFAAVLAVVAIAVSTIEGRRSRQDEMEWRMTLLGAIAMLLPEAREDGEARWPWGVHDGQRFNSLDKDGSQ